jgi:hypothetical protein
MAWIFILIIYQIELKEKLFFEDPKRYRIFYFELRDEYLKNNDFEKLYNISKFAVFNLGENYIFYSDFLISRYFRGKKVFSLIDSINSFFENEDIKRILFLIINLKNFELGEKFIKYLREKEKNENIFSEILYRIYVEKGEYKNAIKEIKKFDNKEIMKIEIKRISKYLSFEDIEKEFKEEEFYPVLAEIAISKNLYEKGINYYIKSKDEEKMKEYVEKNPSYIIKFTENEKDPLILFYRAKAFEKEKNYGEAKKIYETIKDKIGNYKDEIIFSLSKIYLEENEIEKVEEIAHDIKDERRKKEIVGLKNILKGNFEENFKILKEINAPDIIFYLFLSYYFSKNFEKAETVSFKFISNFPKDKRVPEILFLSYLLINFKNKLKDYVDIHYKIFKGEDFEIEIKEEKIDFLYLYLYGINLKKKNKISEALKIFEKIKDGKDIPEIVKIKSLIEIGEIYEKKDKNKAKEIYKNIILNYPKNPFFPFIEEKIKNL